MPALAFFTTILFIPGLPNAATVPRWALLFLIAPILWYKRPNPVTGGHILGACFIGWAVLSLMWTFNLYDGTRSALILGLLALVFCAAPLSLRRVYGAMAIGLAINSGFVIAQSFGWDGVPQMAAPSGLFINKNFGGELSAMVLAGAVASRLWWAVPGILPTLVLSQCRGAWVALGVVGIVLIYKKERLSAWVFGSFMAAVAAYLWQTSNSAHQREDLWGDVWDGLTFWGKGLGSFYTTFPEHATRIDALLFRPSTAHSDLINLAYELGPGVLLLLGLLVYALRARPVRAEHYVLAVFLLEGLVGFPLYMPATALLAALVLGSLCRDRPELRISFAGGRARILYGAEPRYRYRPESVSPSAGGGSLAL